MKITVKKLRTMAKDLIIVIREIVYPEWIVWAE
jgi:hypothetical protein